MTTILQRLVDYPHAAVFDKSANEEIVFRLNHSMGASWVIADAVMTTYADGAFVSSYNLSDITVGQLISSLLGHGFTVTDESAEYVSLSALVLVEGRGDQAISNGNRVTGYTSLMWVLMGGYAGEIREAGRQVIQALRQMIITQAEGEWLDLWGKLYGVVRGQGEGDVSYAPRIPKEAFRLRENPIAIEQAVFDATGDKIRIYEPWTNIFTLDESTLSGEDCLTDGDFYNFHVIQPIGPPGTDWNAVLPVIHRNRAAGIVVYQPGYESPVSWVNYGDYTPEILTRIDRQHVGLAVNEDLALLDYMDIEDISTPNYELLHRRTNLYVSHSTMTDILTWGDFSWVSGYTWKSGSTMVQSKHYRDYRVNYLTAKYSSMPWTEIKNWNTQDSWTDVTAIIRSKHTST